MSWNLDNAIRNEREAWARWQAALEHRRRQEEAEAPARAGERGGATCRACHQPVREGLLYCAGLSGCWREGENVP